MSSSIPALVKRLSRAGTYAESKREILSVGGDVGRRAVDLCEEISSAGRGEWIPPKPREGRQPVIKGEADLSGLRLAGNKAFYEDAMREYPLLPRIWACACKLYSDLLGDDILADAIVSANQLGIEGDLEVRKYLSDTLGAAGRASLEPRASLLVDAGRCGGYLTSSEFSPDEVAEKWFFGEAPFPEVWDLEMLRETKRLMVDYFSFVRTTPGDEDFKTWLETPSNYARSGASKWARLDIVGGGGGTKKLRSKWNIPMASSVDEIVRTVRTVENSEPELRIVAKRETEKVRGVVADDDRRYVLGVYLLQALERRAKSGSNPLSLFWSRKQAVDWYDENCALLDAGFSTLPVDISKFDHDFSAELLAGVQLVILDFLCPGWNDVSSDAMTSSDSVMSMAGVCKAYASCLGSKYKGRTITKGLPSGLAWTALLGSIVNAALSRVLSRLAGITVGLRAHQGDDAAHFLPSEDEAKKLLLAYCISSIPMNAKKNFISLPDGWRSAKSEYLRFVSYSNRVVGYFSRAVPTLLVRNPLNVDPLDSEVEDIAKRWGTIMARGARESVATVYMIDELTARTGLSRADVIEILRTPRSVGGWGFSLYSMTGSVRAVRVSVDGEEKSKPYPKATKGSVFVAAAERSFWLAGTPGASWTEAASKLLPPEGGRLRLEARRVEWSVPKLGLVATSLSLGPRYMKGFDPMFLDAALASLNDDESRRQAVLRVLEDGAWKDLVTRLPASSAMSLVSEGMSAAVPMAVSVSDSVLSVAKKEIEGRMLATLANAAKPNLSVLRRIRLSGELELRLVLRGRVSRYPQYA